MNLEDRLERRRELQIALLIGAVQFINILDFMMVSPLGPDFARALRIRVSDIGYITGSYTLAAFVTGVAGSFFLDRFDRRSALAVCMAGLVLGTFAGGLATGMPSLMAARVLAGAFGGPATSLSFSIVADTIPVERRGKAMAIVLSAFSVSSIAGVPIGLELARRGTWRTPFFGVAGLGIVIVATVIALLPELRGHLAAAKRTTGWRALARPSVYFSYTMTFTVMLAGFIMIPNLSAYFQGNLALPRARLSFVYLIGGLASIVTVNVVGRLIDRFGSFAVGTVGACCFAAVMWFGFIHYAPMPTLILFVAFMLSMNVRNVSYNTLTSKVPGPEERARFMSGQSAIQNLASALGAIVSAKMLTVGPHDTLIHMDRVAWVALALTFTLPPLLFSVERRVARRAPRVAPT